VNYAAEEEEEEAEEEIRADEEEVELFWESVLEGDLEMIDALLVGDEEHPPAGISVEINDSQGRTPLMVLTSEGHGACVQWIIDQAEASVDAQDALYGQSALHFAAVKGHSTIVELLLQRKADPMQRDRAGWTPLHAAARSGSTDVAAVLFGILTEEQINSRGPSKQTALHRAAFWSQLSMVELLLKNGANCDLLDADGRRAGDLIGAGVDQHSEMPTLQKLLERRMPAYDS
ncbi:MAG: hypothetical protein SGPRY_010762, partial [Prymnesium sp.]